MDFGPSAKDYKTHRPGFPRSFFERVPLRGRVLDLGSGTGTLASGYQERGCSAVALDCSAEMLAQADDALEKVVAKAEDCPFPDNTFDAVVSGTAWHWFDGYKVARECRRILKPGGTIWIAYFCYLPIDGSLADETESLILKYNPTWPMAHMDGRHPQYAKHLAAAGFETIAWFDYDEDIPFTREGWRGRMRACNGVMAVPDPRTREQFDTDLNALLLARYPETFPVRHRIFVLHGTAA